MKKQSDYTEIANSTMAYKKHSSLVNSKIMRNFWVCLVLILGSFSVQAQRIHNLDNNSTKETGFRGTKIFEKQEFREAKNSRQFVINSALQNVNSVSVGDVVDLQLFK